MGFCMHVTQKFHVRVQLRYIIRILSISVPTEHAAPRHAPLRKVSAIEYSIRSVVVRIFG